jgi:hypothetical protein
VKRRRKMKKLISILVLFLGLAMILPNIAFAESFFAWDKPTLNEDGSPLVDLGGYEIYCGQSSGDYSIVKDAGLVPDNEGVCEYPIGNVIPQDGAWYCAGKVYDQMGNKSRFSNETFFVVSGGVIDSVAPQPMGNFRFIK